LRAFITVVEAYGRVRDQVPVGFQLKHEQAGDQAEAEHPIAAQQHGQPGLPGRQTGTSSAPVAALTMGGTTGISHPPNAASEAARNLVNMR
jgi:hypothetical protein